MFLSSIISAALSLTLLSTSHAASLVDRASEGSLEARGTEAVNSAVIDRVGTLTISNKVIAPDGYPRSAVLPGGTFPGPLIKGNKGDTFQINVVNELTDDTMPTLTSVHFHGIYQNKTNEYDGVAFVNQCPIVPKSSFLYQFKTDQQAGTFWYHSHLSTQYCDGLRGAMVIYDPEDYYLDWYDVDDETTIITLADWFHSTSTYLNTFTGRTVNPNATLINGAGRYEYGPAVPFSVVSVEKGKRYRFRVLAMACTSAFTFSIDNHNFTVIEADGNPTEALVADSMYMDPGQRYSIIVNANQTVGSYWIRAYANTLNTTFEHGVNSAILRYKGALEEDPTGNYTDPVIPLEEYNLHALQDPAAPGVPGLGNADVNLDIKVLNSYGNWSMNGISYRPPTIPVLLQILSGAREAAELLPEGSLVFLPPNQVVEISIPGIIGGSHPIHLHGHGFSVVRSAASKAYNYVNPVRRDTVSMGNTADNVTFRFTTDNSGPWFLHCHIDWHLQSGFAMVFAENINGTAAALGNINNAWDNLCPTYDSLDAN